ncbi:P2Y purinoceptor 8 [Lingula anatina]|uniref:P2Y purinoceptor 8 n=1 Tax=Lingula anatina TaxID=7574 RepID=A0A1S3J0X1_LINAN|nr:P2Y purinoceptor 8 [Lingula anatina]|eukprot:XP_013403459.1 P2Y purinoceptor 8 [Lingula anatina]
MNIPDVVNSTDSFLIGSSNLDESYLNATLFQDYDNSSSSFMNNSWNISQEQGKVYSQLSLVYQVIPKVLAILGTVGNVLTFIVFLWSKSLRKTALAQFLLALAVTDTLLLWLHLLYTLTASGDLEIRSAVACKVLVWLTDTVTYVSSWLIVTVTFNRFIVIVLPLRATRWCQKRNARIAIFVIVSVFSLVSIYNFWAWDDVFVSKKYYMCKMTRKELIRPRIIMVIVLFSLLPSLTLFTMNGIIMKNLSEALSKQAVYRASFNKQKVKGVQRQLDILLLTLSFSFLILTLPLTLVDIVIFSMYDDTSVLPRDDIFVRLYMSREILNIFSLTNNCLIFPLYCVSGRKFRGELKSVFCRIKLRLEQNVERDPPPDAL